jgi:uncharacterized membrane protein SpoIIM required for sporulation
MMISKNSQRLGDLVARTIVVHQLRRPLTEIQASEEESLSTQNVIPLALYKILERYLRRKDSLTEETRARACLSLTKELSSFIDLPQPQSYPNVEAREEYLRKVFYNVRPARVDTSSKTGGRQENWTQIREDLKKIDVEFQDLENSKKLYSADELFNVAQNYQKLCQRYGYLSTFYPDVFEALEASRLVRFGRRLIYGRRLGVLAESKTPFLKMVPQSFSVIKNYCFLSLFLGIIGATLSSVLVQINPNLSWHFLSEDVVKDLAAGNIWTEKIKGMSTIAASSIMTNNIKVTISAFALGITGGVGTAIIIIFNGVHLGGIFSALSHYDMTRPLLNFILAHGFLELSVIFVAGGAGLFLGDAILNPGALSRKQALQKNGALIVDLIFFNAACLVLAGLVEGYISPFEEIGVFVKLFIGLSLGFIYWWFLLTGRFLPRLSIK